MSRWQPPTDDTSREARMCASKRRFETWDHALPVALAAGRVAPQRIYLCDYCDGFHLTSHHAITVPKQKAPTT